MTLLLSILLVAALERMPRLRFRRSRVLRPHAATDVVYLLTGYVAGGALAAAYVRAAARILAPAWVAWPAVPFAAQVTVALVALDLGNYLVHWWLHRSDILWEFHKAHHSSRQLDWLAAFRSHAVEQVLRRALAPALLIVLGVPAPAVTVAAGVFFVWAMLIHANLRLPLDVLEVVCVTPRLHRMHHVPQTTERNLGTVFTLWDRVRGTLVLTDTPPGATCGLPGEAETYPQDWRRQLVEPWTRTAARLGSGRPAAAVGRERNTYGQSRAMSTTVLLQQMSTRCPR